MWLIIFAVSILAGLGAAYYMAGKVKRTGIFKKLENRVPARVPALLSVVAAVAVLCLVFDVTNTIIIVIHIAAFLLAGDFVAFLLRKLSGKDIPGRKVDLCALLLCVIYLCIGWYLMHGLWETDYSLATDKNAGQIRIAQIADSHIGTGFSGKGFGEKLARIQETDPDILVITGDFVDDSTMKQDMVDACDALGNFDAKYGIYYCFGNHDAGYRSTASRGYDAAELIANLERNGVTVLQDQSVLIDDRFYVIGRRDAGYGGSDRQDINTLIEGLDRNKYMVVLDHQPVDYDAEAASGVDLVLSGHTHGGQVFPLEFIQPLVSDNDNVRGYERREGTDFIVTDGISDWAIKFKTGCKSEFNIIDITGK